MVSQKKFESKIMAIAPLGITLFLKMSSPDFVAPLYEFGTPELYYYDCRIDLCRL